MKKSSALRFLLFSILTLFALTLIIMITFPKYLLLDNLLSSKGIFLFPKTVKEGLTSIELTSVSLYDKNSRIGRFEKIKVQLTPSGIKLSGKDKKGFLEVSYNLLNRSYSIKAKDLESFDRFSVEEAAIEIGNQIQGTLKVRGIKVTAISLDSVNIDFKGKTFEVEAKGDTVNSRGAGVIVVNNKNPFDSTLNGEIVDRGIKIIVSGTLKNLKFDLKTLTQLL